MEQKPIACGNRLPPISANYPWLVAQNLDCTGDQTFYTMHNQLCQFTMHEQLFHYQCRLPKLHGRRIRGYFHGWVILSSKNLWSLWNPVTSKIINLPPLTLNNSESIGQCCLSSPPDDPVSVLLLTIRGKSTLVFCRLGFKRDRLRWRKMPYTRQLKEIVGFYGGLLECLTLYKGKVYALCLNDFVIQVDITVKDGEVLIKLLLLGRGPSPPYTGFPISIPLLKGSCTELFCIIVYFDEVANKTLGNFYLFKWDMYNMRWEEMVDIKDAIFFVDLASDYSVYYNHAIASEFGGYIYMRDETGKIMYTCDIEDKTISASLSGNPTSHMSLWECRLEGDHEESKFTVDFEKEQDMDDKMVLRSGVDNEVESNESRLLNLPFHLLEMIMDHCIGIEYMCFRATCKSIHLAAPLIHWNNKTTSKRLHNYSLVSPWLMVVDKNQSVITFTDPLFGDKYFMKRSQLLVRHGKILCSRFGWVLFCSSYSILVFFNPFTGEHRELPYVKYYLDSLCFSAPPTSPDCMVVGFKKIATSSCVCVHFVGREQTWHMIRVDFGRADPHGFSFPTFCGQDLYALCDTGDVYVFTKLFMLQGYNFKTVVGARSREGEYFFVKHDQQFLLVIVGKFGEYVDVFKLNLYNEKWEKVDCLGRYTIYICDNTCLSIETEVPEMENKIFFSRLHSKNGNIVFYSLETCRYHRYNGKNIEEVDGIGLKHVNPHAWVEPTWS